MYLKTFDQCDVTAMANYLTGRKRSERRHPEIAVDAMGFVEWESRGNRETISGGLRLGRGPSVDGTSSAKPRAGLDAMHEARMEHALREVFERIDADSSGSMTRRPWRVYGPTPISLMF